MTKPRAESCRAATCGYPVPFGQSTKGGQTTLEPTPSASLAPTASYTMVDPGAKGPPGAVGLSLPCPRLSHPAATTKAKMAMAIREIGELCFTAKKVQVERR